ncbi:MAG TPA: di-heme oxidoredictase family protein [Polyangiaceae bacterium]|nr:di-heme oxidoredictase family protein [Polyangiaceae bacterium]
MVNNASSRRRRSLALGGLAAAVVCGAGISAYALVTSASDRALVSNVEGTAMAALGGHIVQATLTNMVLAGNNAGALALAFDHGDEMFAAKFNAADGSGANVGAGSRFTRMPRADLKGAGQWATHTPARATGPNTVSCTNCHQQGGDDGGGPASGNVHRDANHLGQLNRMVQRNTPHVFGLGALQRLAEEMTVDLQAVRSQARTNLGCGVSTTGNTSTSNLSSKGVSFGQIRITHTAGSTACTETLIAPATGAALPLSADLVVRPFQWKGSTATIRDFVRGAAHNEIGMQGTELLGSPTVDPATVDGDGDGVANELFVGDITALTIYQAGQPRPTTLQELAAVGAIPALPAAQVSAITDGSAIFDRMGCGSCHTRRLTINNPVFQEPSALQAFRDAGDLFPNGRSYGNAALRSDAAVHFDLTRDALENGGITTTNGQPLGTFQRDAQGHALVDLFGDLRRHDMGSKLAEEVDEQGTGASVFMTENLWGVGSTAPYLHDGRAASLSEAILEHGGEGQSAHDNFVSASLTAQQHLIAFLNSLVLFKEG